MNAKKISFSEFKFWLQGVEEMQDAGWSPSPAQWEKIKEKLALVEMNGTPQPVPTAVPSWDGHATPRTSFAESSLLPPDVEAVPAPRDPPPEFFRGIPQSELDQRAKPRETSGTYQTAFK